MIASSRRAAASSASTPSGLSGERGSARRRSAPGRTQHRDAISAARTRRAPTSTNRHRGPGHPPVGKSSSDRAAIRAMSAGYQVHGSNQADDRADGQRARVERRAPCSAYSSDEAGDASRAARHREETASRRRSAAAATRRARRRSRTRRTRRARLEVARRTSRRLRRRRCGRRSSDDAAIASTANGTRARTQASHVVQRAPHDRASRSQSETCAGCIVSVTTPCRSCSSVARSICSRSRAPKPSSVRCAS